MKSDHWIARVIQGITGTAVASITMVAGGFVALFVLSLILQQCSLSVSHAAVIHIWIDDSGMINITNTPLPENARIITRISYNKVIYQEVVKSEPQREVPIISTASPLPSRAEKSEAAGEGNKEEARKIQDKIEEKERELAIIYSRTGSMSKEVSTTAYREIQTKEQEIRHLNDQLKIVMQRK